MRPDDLGQAGKKRKESREKRGWDTHTFRDTTEIHIQYVCHCFLLRSVRIINSGFYQGCRDLLPSV